MAKGRTLQEFEQKEGGGRVHELQMALEQSARARKKIVLEVPDENNTIRFGVIGDTQFGNIFEAKDQLRAFYEMLFQRGIGLVLHAGDVLDGHKVYKGQEFEQHALGWAKQRAWFAEVAPKFRGIQTHFITGNHDGSLKKLCGLDVGVELEKERPDWHFLGEDHASITLRTKNERAYVIRLVHPSGGTAYAISYKSQKQAESIEGGRKPNMIVMGHYHKAEHLPNYRNIDILQAGCFEWQTPFMASLPTPAHVGGWIVGVTLQPKRLFCNSINAEFVAFYRENEED